MPAKGEIYTGIVPKLSLMEMLELRQKRNQDKELAQRKAENFMHSNLGHLTGTQSGSANRKIYTKVAIGQVGDLANPKAAPKKPKHMKGAGTVKDVDSRAASIKREKQLFQKSTVHFNTHEDSGVMNSSRNRSLHSHASYISSKVAGLNENTLPVVEDLNKFIASKLMKDKKLSPLPAVNKLSKGRVLNMLRKSQRFIKDQETTRNIKAVLSMRDRFLDNHAGKYANGLELKVPRPLRNTEMRRSSLTKISERKGASATDLSMVKRTFDSNASFENLEEATSP